MERDFQPGRLTESIIPFSKIVVSLLIPTLLFSGISEQSIWCFTKIPSTYARPFVNSEIPPYVSFVNEKLQQTREGRKEPAWKKKKEQRHPHRDKWSLRKWMGGWLENVVYWFSVERSCQCVPGKGESCTHSNMRTTFVELVIRCATSTCLFHLIWPTAPLHMFFIMVLASFFLRFSICLHFRVI